MSTWTHEVWLNPEAIKKINYSSYWNNEENEKTKDWYILDGNFQKMEDYLEATGLKQDLIDCLSLIEKKIKSTLSGTGIDLAAGILWTAPVLVKHAQIDKLLCLEFSEHRLLTLGTKVLDYYHVPQEKVSLILGSFYELHLSDGSLDFVLLSTAFHHADNPSVLLAEIRRVLKPGGFVIIIGEHLIGYYKKILTHTAKYVFGETLPVTLQQAIFKKTLKSGSLTFKTRELFPPDDILGDHYYSVNDYRKLFTASGFSYTRSRNKKMKYQSFLLRKK